MLLTAIYSLTLNKKNAKVVIIIKTALSFERFIRNLLKFTVSLMEHQEAHLQQQKH